MKKQAIAFLGIAVAACAPQRPADRRTDFASDCIYRGGNPVECAQAAEMVIPREGKQ